ncbi:MAG TPA: hypothetical protein VE685_00830 [Thermoanaerobaculia bacterium]|nr:hypothetical protein [Thermoanaerobaculia bacterium]
MKKNLKKLLLSRETLRHLEISALRDAAVGGETAGCTIQGDSRSCFNTCSWQQCPGGSQLTCVEQE